MSEIALRKKKENISFHNFQFQLEHQEDDAVKEFKSTVRDQNLLCVSNPGKIQVVM